MTEIALALAMAFFSIMVLAMISMGVPPEDAAKPANAAVLADARPDSAPSSTIEPVKEDVVVIFHGGRFMNAELAPLDPGSLPKGARVILALDPQLPMRDALDARSRIDAADLVVTALDERWLTALRRNTDDRQ